jgi:hypothetical protein
MSFNIQIHLFINGGSITFSFNTSECNAPNLHHAWLEAGVLILHLTRRIINNGLSHSTNRSSGAHLLNTSWSYYSIPSYLCLDSNLYRRILVMNTSVRSSFLNHGGSTKLGPLRGNAENCLHYKLARCTCNTMTKTTSRTKQQQNLQLGWKYLGIFSRAHPIIQPVKVSWLDCRVICLIRSLIENTSH